MLLDLPKEMQGFQGTYSYSRENVLFNLLALLKYLNSRLIPFSMAVKSICLIGVSGDLGSLILKHLLAPKQYTVTVLSRKSSTARVPDGVTVTRLPDD